MATSKDAGIRPVVAAGIIMGAGLGGFIDGIVFHQILQWHNMLSARLTPDNLIDAKINMFWDGIFHAGVWILTVIGLILLWHAGKKKDVFWSGKAFAGSLVAGWGVFNLIEGLIDHMILNIHHVNEYSASKLPFDLAFLASGALMLLIGWLLIVKAKKSLREEPYASGLHRIQH